MYSRDTHANLCFSPPFIVDLSNGIELVHPTNRSNRIMTAPKEIIKLVERFEHNKEQYTSGNYKEEQLRLEFLNPFFSALGWDIENRQGYAEPYKEVIHEDAIKIGSATKAPDYAFRIGGTRKFFVEAKTPSVNLKEDFSPSYQLRRYAWSAKLPLSILTDFQEFAIYDCRTKPLKTDKASTGRVRYLTYNDYATEWDSIATVFSKEAVLKGSFDKFAESTKGKKGTTEVDDAFLKEIESWRELLAKNIALRNPKLSQPELNFSVQRTIDRIIFLRICEDRGIEPYAKLLTLVNGERVYRRLYEQFYRADEKYNSGLFHFETEKDRAERPDELTPNLHIDDKPLKEIIGNLYYPDCPYEFSVLPADILGQVYEQFLGKVIRLTAGHQAKVEEKPEVKKAGGVYYTPTYIVDYIVKNTVGKLLDPELPLLAGEGKGEVGKRKPTKPLTPKEASSLRILDPACGSGSFLIGAYQYLLNWHRESYEKDGAEKHATGKNAALFRGPGGEWRLTTGERKRILLNNIYGVDIDSQAVEVTKLSLLLKVLEGENEQTISQQLKMFHERALPDLSNNIKCGNSLIGPDFYDGKQLSLLDDEEKNRINVFDWKKEFKEIMDAGGFDAVIGNPPYIRIQAMKEWAPIEVEFYKQAYKSASAGNYDIYVVFVERGLGLICKHGVLGFILPHKFFNARYGEALRTLVAEGRNLSQVVHFGDQQIFDGATTYTCLLFLSKTANDVFEMIRVQDLSEWLQGSPVSRGKLKMDVVSATEWNFPIGEGADLFEKLNTMPLKLADVASIFVGLQTSADTVFLFKDTPRLASPVTKVYSKALAKDVQVESGILKPVVRSGEIGRYWASATAHVLFPYAIEKNGARLLSEAEIKRTYPRTWSYLEDNKSLLSEREHSKFKATGWYQLYPKNLDVWESPKLLMPYMITRLAAQVDRSKSYFVNVTTGGFGLRFEERDETLEYYAGLLNSKLLDWFFKKVSTTFHGGYFAANKQFLDQLPIRTINFSDSSDKSRHDKMVQLVEQMLSLHKQLPAAKTEQEKTVIQRQIEATDKQIDQLVYELYELTEEEIKIVEGKA